MGKRSDFKRVARDFYPTPYEAALLLSPYLGDVKGFGEPCIGNADLAQHLERLGHTCVWGSDIAPGPIADLCFDTIAMPVDRIEPQDALCISHFITNPPWPAKYQYGEPTLGIIRHLSAIRPTWLLLSADFKHNGYAAEVLAYCRKIVSVGRVRWIEDSANDGKDNCAWYLFDQNQPGPTIFHGRGDRKPVYSAEVRALV